MESTKIDVIIETMREAITPITDIFNEQNENAKVSSRVHRHSSCTSKIPT